MEKTKGRSVFIVDVLFFFVLLALLMQLNYLFVFYYNIISMDLFLINVGRYKCILLCDFFVIPPFVY